MIEVPNKSASLVAQAPKKSPHEPLNRTLKLGVGVATGYATCGRVGFEGRYEYAAIGTVTNLAARLCSEAEGGQVLISQRIATLLEGRLQAELKGNIEFKGIAKPVPTWVVRSLQ